jgi:hypothetical protein
MSTAGRYSSLSMSEVSPIELSHDSISRWLHDQKFTPSDIWKEAKQYINKPFVLMADDSVLDKSRSTAIDLVHWQYSGNVHQTIPGIGVLNFVANMGEDKIPFDYRIYNPPEDGKTKNDHFRDMIKIAHSRGLNPEYVAADCWYSSLDNLKCIRGLGWLWVMGLRSNRKVNRNIDLKNIEISEQGTQVHLKGYGFITVFRFESHDGRTDYVGTNKENPTREEIKKVFRCRWEIEVYHREIKQTCGIEKCQSLSGRAQRNHISLSIYTWIKRSRRRLFEEISIYQQKWEIIKPAITQNMENILNQNLT